MKLALKDAEIQRLQASLQARETEDQSAVIDNLRTDMAALIEKNQRSNWILFELLFLFMIELFGMYHLSMKKSVICEFSLSPRIGWGSPNLS